MNHLRVHFTVIFWVLFVTGTTAQTPAGFTNPLLPAGADPWCVYKDGFYYYTHTTGRNITLWKTPNLSLLKTAPRKVVFTPPATGPYSKEIWAPEIHFLKDRWYIYFAADSGNNVDHRLWVLENTAADPLTGEWTLKGKLTTPEDKWSIDGTVVEHEQQLYLLWSGWEGDTNGRQDIYIAEMSNPWTVTGPRVRLSSPQLPWETHGDLKDPNDVPHVNVNEGPQLLRRNGNVFLVYSASGCWTDFYALGMLQLRTGGRLMDTAAWIKSPAPVFSKSEANKVYAPGHNSFFTSPDGKEDYILYHANSQPNQGCGKFRSPRAQRFSWRADGTPYFGIPVKEGKWLPAPSGSTAPKVKKKGTLAPVQ